MFEIKVAIVQYKPTETIRTGYENASITIAKVFKKIGVNTKVKVFSIGHVNSNNLIDKEIEQETVRGINYPEHGLGLIRIIDFISILIFESRLTQVLMDKNKLIQAKLSQFKPDILIIGSIQPYGIVKRYKLKYPKCKIICYTDSPKTIEDAFEAINYLPIQKVLKSSLKRVLKKRYMRYALNIYRNMINTSDAIVVPSLYDKNRIIKELNIEPKKIFVIPPIMFDPLQKLNSKRIPNIRNVLFVGTCGLYANDEAINAIEKYIAPKLPDIKFLISGKGCIARRNKNFIVLSEKIALKKVLEEADLCIAPILQTGGMKTKMATYFAAGKPTIGTTIAFEGYPVKNGFNAIIEDDIKKYHERIRELNNNLYLLNKIQLNTKNILEAFSTINLRKNWVNVLSYIKKIN